MARLTLTAFCDLKFCPISFDFVTWLVRAMKERDKAGCDGLHVVLVPHEEGLGGFSRVWGEHDEAATRWRLWHILMAAIPLAGTKATVTFASGRSQCKSLSSEFVWWPQGKAHFMGPLVESAKRGEKISKLRATDAARRYVSHWGLADKFATLTCRNQSTCSDRNSDADAWDRFSKTLKIPFIRLDDTNQALGKFGGKWSELDIDVRLALYEKASMNLIGNNGPSVLLQLSDAPYINFGFGYPENWLSHVEKYFSLKNDEQLPWANKNQKLVYGPDTFESLKAEFEKWDTATAS